MSPYTIQDKIIIENMVEKIVTFLKMEFVMVDVVPRDEDNVIFVHVCDKNMKAFLLVYTRDIQGLVYHLCDTNTAVDYIERTEIALKVKPNPYNIKLVSMNNVANFFKAQGII